MTEEINVTTLKNWGRPRKTKTLPAFLLPKEEREKLLHYKKHVRGRPKG
ncbi:hypothetical protein KAU88_04800 [Candidatus Bathyarchaeota archaeon]|nr:hypothetical protein [Candidatus Bathyarchaeota archaeon]